MLGEVLYFGVWYIEYYKRLIEYLEHLRVLHK